MFKGFNYSWIIVQKKVPFHDHFSLSLFSLPYLFRYDKMTKKFCSSTKLNAMLPPAKIKTINSRGGMGGGIYSLGVIRGHVCVWITGQNAVCCWWGRPEKTPVPVQEWGRCQESVPDLIRDRTLLLAILGGWLPPYHHSHPVRLYSSNTQKVKSLVREFFFHLGEWRWPIPAKFC